MTLEPALRERNESLHGANRVVLYKKGQPAMPQCGFSAKAVGVLQDLGVDVGENQVREQDQRQVVPAFCTSYQKCSG